MNPAAFVMLSLAGDTNLDPVFARAFAPTQRLDRFLPPAEPVDEFDGRDPDDEMQRERDNERDFT